MVEIETLKFDEKGLIPAIVVDEDTKQVLMMAYMNKESLTMTLETKLATFYSRSREKLWVKGEQSKNFQHVVSVVADCDRDTLLVSVHPDGPACHLNTTSCFSYPMYQPPFTYKGLYQLLQQRKEEGKEGSYTTYLFEKGLDKILKKVGEESTEVIIAAKAQDKAETIYEIADLTYHLMVLMVEAGIDVDDITEELASRHVIDHKIKQEKMR
ncbi:MAG: bifunctional phosphoribosyl-AMP cyclohydrolase/phosphoribosyl-ATP diphosphatase HisIE [Lachnospiraceae bacterium]|nr:bifunctional phosphoribosyl-AMP cyclohydrolase/phosphoribosyl-ATP diphosphatase HisIE [Lachnospiraceae bacterium]